jgi:hypothetical protein
LCQRLSSRQICVAVRQLLSSRAPSYVVLWDLGSPDAVAGDVQEGSCERGHCPSSKGLRQLAASAPGSGSWCGRARPISRTACRSSTRPRARSSDAFRCRRPCSRSCGSRSSGCCRSETAAAYRDSFAGGGARGVGGTRSLLVGQAMGPLDQLLRLVVKRAAGAPSIRL